jgi:hypothetical protein
MFGQLGWSSTHLPAHIALVLPSLPLHSFSSNSSFFFPQLTILFHTIVTRHAHEHPPQSLHVFVVSLFFSRTTTRFRNHHHHLYVFRALRMFVLPSAIRHFGRGILGAKDENLSLFVSFCLFF